MTKGSCLCGKVRFETDGPLRPVIACHCQQCRKTTGHHVAATSAPRDSFDIVGDVTWYQSSDTAKRGFCGTCGSQMFWDGAGGNLSIMAGCIDGPTGLKLAGHIYCADKGDYYEIADDLPKADQADDTLTTMIVGGG